MVSSGRVTKLSEGRSVRHYKNEAITKLEKQLGKKKFTELFSQEIVKPAGRPTLVPNSDRRQGIGTSNPKEEFKEEK